jgi:hypothetical protein
MGIFGPPDFEQMRRDGDWPRLIHWSLYDKDPASCRAARDALKADPYPLVEYLYETALWARLHRVGHKKTLPRRSVMLLNEADRALTRLGGAAVEPLVAAVELYDEYGDPDEDMKWLLCCLVVDILKKIGRPAGAGLRRLAASPDESVAGLAKDTLDDLAARGLVEPSARGGSSRPRRAGRAAPPRPRPQT